MLSGKNIFLTMTLFFKGFLSPPCSLSCCHLLTCLEGPCPTGSVPLSLPKRESRSHKEEKEALHWKRRFKRVAVLWSGNLPCSAPATLPQALGPSGTGLPGYSAFPPSDMQPQCWKPPCPSPSRLPWRLTLMMSQYLGCSLNHSSNLIMCWGGNPMYLIKSC